MKATLFLILTQPSIPAAIPYGLRKGEYEAIFSTMFS